MPQSCCVFECNHYSTRKFPICRLFRFPSNEKRALAWEKNIRRPDWKRVPWSRICECHFEEQEFEQHRLDGKKKLLPTALPSIFPTHTIKLPARFSPDKQQLLNDSASHETTALKQLPNDNRCAEASSQVVQDGCASPNSDDLHLSDESTANLLQRREQEIALLRQTLHNYKQRAWHMDIVLSALRKENELLRGALQEINPGELNRLLDLQGS